MACGKLHKAGRDWVKSNQLRYETAVESVVDLLTSIGEIEFDESIISDSQYDEIYRDVLKKLENAYKDIDEAWLAFQDIVNFEYEEPVYERKRADKWVRRRVPRKRSRNRR